MYIHWLSGLSYVAPMDIGLNEIPTDHHMRSLLDPLDVLLVRPVFRKVFEARFNT